MGTTVLALKNEDFREGMTSRKNNREKWLKPLSKLILDFGLAKGKSAVEFREGS
jgi:hypothetical protein